MAAVSLAAAMMAVSSKKWLILFMAGMLAMSGMVFASEPEADSSKSVKINLASRILTVYDGDVKIGIYPVGPGKISTPSPTGSFAIFSMIENPEWIDPKDEKKRVPSGEANPLGYRWMGFYDTYGIHGTNMPGSIGWYVSNGCIRMYEDDVEKVFDIVNIGTPVDIYYDRLVIDRAADHTISYYIYPDGYGWQSVDVAYVNHALAGYGVADFVSNADINLKIEASDGEPTVIGTDYRVYVNDELLPMRAFQQGAILYLPAKSIADALGVPVEWNAENNILTSPFGQVQGFKKKQNVYFSSKDTLKLFYLQGGLSDNLNYELHTDWRTGLSNAIEQGPLYPDEISFMTFIKALYSYVF